MTTLLECDKRSSIHSIKCHIIAVVALHFVKWSYNYAEGTPPIVSN